MHTALVAAEHRAAAAAAEAAAAAAAEAPTSFRGKINEFRCAMLCHSHPCIRKREATEMSHNNNHIEISGIVVRQAPFKQSSSIHLI